ncbi:hypothetical protein G7046_g9266 [Stylonectria norvegica]|nr:hypothetical protein G7046_g9266 [Stylonectria norvegica]
MGYCDVNGVLLETIGLNLYTDDGKGYYNLQELSQSVSPGVLNSPAIPDAAPGHRRLVLLIEANVPNTNLCKFIASALLLGYPSPIIINWNRVFDSSTDWFGGHHLTKIVGVTEYLDLITRDSTDERDRLNDDDIVLLLDAFDVWFQLGPDVLLQRYHQAIREGNSRLTAQWPGVGVPPMVQTIFWSTQKKCYPNITQTGGTLIHCDAMPESPLRKDLYGPRTDMDFETNPKGFHDLRPRYINGGSVIGPVGHLKRFFRRTKEKMEKAQSGGFWVQSNQGLFGMVLGEQEIFRNWMRENRPDPSSLPHYNSESFFMNEYEFHAGLDYTQQMFLPTFATAGDATFIKLNNKTGIADYSETLNISVRIDGVPQDIQTSYNPLKGIKPAPDYIAPEWDDMPLYADFYTEAVPVIIHHNEHANGAKNRRELWWDRTWYFPYLRTLLNKSLKPSPLKPLARILVEEGEIVYWASKSNENVQKLPRTFFVSNRTAYISQLSLDSTCKSPGLRAPLDSHWWDEVFRDGLGPL